MNSSNTSRKSVFISRLKFGASLLVALALFALGMIAMETRMENATPSLPSPSHSESNRQDLAILTQRLINTSQADPNLVSLGKVGEEWEKQLGGIWIPWPAKAPADQSNPKIDVSAFPADPASLGKELEKYSSSIRKISESPEQSQLSTSISASALIIGAKISPQSVSIALPQSSKITSLMTQDVLKRLEEFRQWLEMATSQKPRDQRGKDLEIIAFLDRVISDSIHAGTPLTSAPLAKLPSTDVKLADLISRELISVSGKADEEQRAALAQTVAFVYLTLSPDTPATPGYQP
ncbi:hypothetical protein [Arcanobacterium ihumii]|uniref:hypothetical protein n=1 Tax=Arcanobacterium ihumii TaxID=2138162 RepID=UPI000F537BCA|nr:hypothetical protein [Arcanobacterium ihumii]